MDFANSDVIKPPDPYKHKEIKIKRVVIDSRDRDITQYPKPNDYVVVLDELIDDVVTGEIVLMDIPFSSYVININNNFFEADNEILYIETGDYSKTTLVNVLQNALNTNTKGKTYTVTYNTNKDNYTITCNQEFTIKFVNYLSEMVGFVKDIEYTGTELVSIYRSNFNVNKYIVLKIDYMTINFSSNSNIHKSSAVVYKNELSLNTKSNISILKKWFNPIIPKLYKLRIQLYDYYGNLYDFQNQNHRIDILFENRKHTLKYTF
jgi:hypothetical protein